MILANQILPVQAINRSIGMDAAGYDKDLTVKAPQSSVLLNFPVPRLAKVQSAMVNISISPASQLNDEAMFFFYLNDKLLETHTARDLKQKKLLSINLPVDGEYKDGLRLQIKSNMFMTNDICRDFTTGGLFYTVHKESKIDLNYEMLPVRNVADFFGNFQQSLAIVVPDKAGLSEMMPAAWIYGIIKKNYPHLDLQVTKAAELGNKPYTPRIWVGLRNQLPTYFSRIQTGIALADQNTLLISAVNVSELATFARQVADLPVFPMKTAGGAPVKNAAGEGTGSLSKEKIFFGSQAVQEGILQVSSVFPLYLSLLGSVPEKLGVHLEGSHMVAMDRGKPTRLDVFFNNNLVHSSVLDQSGRFSRDIDVPSGANFLSRNSINVQFNYPEEPGQCQVRGKVQSAQIFPNSYLWGSGERKIANFTWSNIGLFFTRPGMILIDEKLGENPLNLLTNAVSFLNQQLPASVYAFPIAQTLTEQTFLPPEHYVVALIMAGNEPPFLQALMPGAQGQNLAESKDSGLAIPMEYKTSVNSVVGTISGNNGFPIVVFSAKQKGSLMAEALRLLSQSGPYSGLTGNVLAYRQPGVLYSTDVRDAESIAASPKEAPKGMIVRFWNQRKNEILLACAVLAGIVLLFLLIGYIKRRRARNHLEPAYASGNTQSRSIVYAKQRSARKSQVVTVSPTLAKNTGRSIEYEADTAKSIAKKRGRPKRQAAVAESAPKTVEPVTVHTNKSEAGLSSLHSSDSAVRKRGRPRKSVIVAAPAAIQPETSVDRSGAVVNSQQKPEPVAKKRGRPKRSGSVAESMAKIPEFVVDPRKKAAVVPTQANSQAQIATRGRPKKQNAAEKLTRNEPETITAPKQKKSVEQKREAATLNGKNIEQKPKTNVAAKREKRDKKPQIEEAVENESLQKSTLNSSNANKSKAKERSTSKGRFVLGTR